MRETNMLLSPLVKMFGSMHEQKKYSFRHGGDSEVCLTLLRKQTVEAREAKRD